MRFFNSVVLKSFTKSIYIKWLLQALLNEKPLNILQVQRPGKAVISSSLVTLCDEKIGLEEVLVVRWPVLEMGPL